MKNLEVFQRLLLEPEAVVALSFPNQEEPPTLITRAEAFIYLDKDVTLRILEGEGKVKIPVFGKEYWLADPVNGVLRYAYTKDSYHDNYLYHTQATAIKAAQRMRSVMDLPTNKLKSVPVSGAYYRVAVSVMTYSGADMAPGMAPDMAPDLKESACYLRAEDAEAHASILRRISTGVQPC